MFGNLVKFPTVQGVGLYFFLPKANIQRLGTLVVCACMREYPNATYPPSSAGFVV